MQKAGFNVPTFLVLSSKDIEIIFKDALEEIENKLTNIHSANDSKLPEVCESIQQTFLNAEISKEFCQTILNKCKNHFGENFCIAIRSSAMSEDTDNSSFAGQHSTFLYTSENTIFENIKNCLASAWSYNAIIYRLLHNISIRKIKFAIVLQKMAMAEKSGIGFSMNINGNMVDTVLNAGYGIGEGIVSDKVETDTYFVNRANKGITKNCVLKKNALIYDNEIKLADIPEELQKKDVLNEVEILQVFDLMMKAELILGKPADIEFLFSSKGEFFILQMRPITTINPNNLAILDNTNIVESYSGLTLPLSYSFASLAYSNVFKGSAKAFWISSEKFNQNDNIFDNLLFHFYGRVYYRLDNWYKMTALAYNSKKSMQAWEKAVGLPDSASNKYKFSLVGKIKTIFSSIWLILNYKKGNKKFFKYFKINYNTLLNYDKHSQSPEILWKYFNEIVYKSFEKWHFTIINDFLAFKSFGWLQNLIRKYKISDNEEFANELVCGHGEVESEIAVVSLLHLKDMINASSELSTIFTLSDEEVLANINDKKIPEFTDKWDAYLQRFGDRTLAELKLETKSPRKNPIFLIQLMKNQLKSKISGESFKQRQELIKKKSEETVQKYLKWWMPKKYLFIFVLKLARYGLTSRENMRFCRTRMYSACKDIFLEFGKMMTNANIIREPEDIFYLNMQEIQDFCTNQNLEPKQNYINQIKEQYKIYNNITLPDRIIFPIYEIPDISLFQTNASYSDIENVNKQLNNERIFKGIAVSKGVIEGEAIVITEPILNADVRGKILVTKITDPGWVFLMSQSIALVSEKGSLLSHTAIVGRELGIPVVVGIKDIIQKIKTGDKIRVNGTTGVVEKL